MKPPSHLFLFVVREWFAIVSCAFELKLVGGFVSVFEFVFALV